MNRKGMAPAVLGLVEQTGTLGYYNWLWGVITEPADYFWGRALASFSHSLKQLTSGRHLYPNSRGASLPFFIALTEKSVRVGWRMLWSKSPPLGCSAECSRMSRRNSGTGSFVCGRESVTTTPGFGKQPGLLEWWWWFHSVLWGAKKMDSTLLLSWASSYLCEKAGW